MLFEAIEKLNREIGNSNRNTKVAVLHPIRSVWCKSTFGKEYDAKFLTAQFRQLVDNLLDIHIDFDLLDESEVDTARVHDGKVQAGAVEYSYVIVPESTTISSSTVKMLSDFSEAGGKVIFINGRPDTVEGDKQHVLVNRIRKIKMKDKKKKKISAMRIIRPS